MARPRADDYLEKQQLILDQAAILFARKGFAGASIASIAELCNASKALIYHYYQSKESMLFDMLHTHCELLLKTAQDIMEQPEVHPEQKLRQLLRSFMAIYVSARAKHVVLLNDLHWLPEREQKQIRELERKVVDIFKGLVRSIRPDLSEKTVTALSMSLMGSINWTYIWFKPEGALTPQKFADITAGLFFAGIDSIADDVDEPCKAEGGRKEKAAAARIAASSLRMVPSAKASRKAKVL
jgi:AcrR family transcriptional regulator